eukprot:30491_1
MAALPPSTINTASEKVKEPSNRDQVPTLADNMSDRSGVLLTFIVLAGFYWISPTQFTSVLSPARMWLTASWHGLHTYYSDFGLFVVITSLVPTVIYWVLGSVLSAINVFNPQFSLEYKIQDGSNVPLDRHRFWLVVKAALCNMPISWATIWVVYRWIDPSRVLSDDLPSLATAIRNIGFFLIVEEIGFYYSHRMLHTRFFYGRVHKKHHEWTAPIALVAVYSHPFEHVLANVLPMMVGPLLLQAHVVEWWVWHSFGMTNTLFSHSGYHFPMLQSPEGHDFHHLRFNEIFGVLGILDWLHGTDKEFRRSKHKSLHKVYFSTAYKEERIRKVERIQKPQN